MNQKHIVIIFVILTILGLGIAGVNSIKSTLTQSGITSTPVPGVTINPNNDKQTQDQNNNMISKTPQITPSPKQYRQFPGSLAPEELKNKKATIETSKGTISLEIYPEATKAASNFIFLVKDGYYDGLTFHRVEDWVIQGGDPTGVGSGGPGYQFADEPVTRPYVKGVLAMANSGPNTNGSQFFILKKDTPLPPKYTIFGQVLSGQEVVDQIQIGDIMKKVVISSLK